MNEPVMGEIVDGLIEVNDSRISEDNRAHNF